ncbi:MAG TPA: sugar isomerase [Thermoleophilia bacterium]|nr:sugar isomerase [Thermoleophilia bacterium]
MSKTLAELVTQPACWRRAEELASDPAVAAVLPSAGSETAVVGCGTSLFMARSYAALREAAGAGRTDAFPASEFPMERGYGTVLALCRSGTTTEVVRLLERLSPETETLVVTAVEGTPAPSAARHAVVLPFADEESVVQTRFATTALALLRAALGGDVAGAAADAERALAAELPIDPLRIEQVTYLGAGWTAGLADEAALKLREAAQFWAESYLAMEYRHGPISIAMPGRAVWPLSPLPPGLAGQVRETGATLVDTGDLDPMAALVLAQRFAVEAALARGLDPDHPRALTRAVILSDKGETS